MDGPLTIILKKTKICIHDHKQNSHSLSPLLFYMYESVYFISIITCVSSNLIWVLFFSRYLAASLVPYDLHIFNIAVHENRINISILLIYWCIAFLQKLRNFFLSMVNIGPLVFLCSVWLICMIYDNCCSMWSQIESFRMKHGWTVFILAVIYGHLNSLWTVICPLKCVRFVSNNSLIV